MSSIEGKLKSNCIQFSGNMRLSPKMNSFLLTFNHFGTLYQLYAKSPGNFRGGLISNKSRVPQIYKLSELRNTIREGWLSDRGDLRPSLSGNWPQYLKQWGYFFGTKNGKFLPVTRRTRTNLSWYTVQWNLYLLPLPFSSYLPPPSSGHVDRLFTAYHRFRSPPLISHL